MTPDKILPAAVEVEEAVIGVLLSFPESISSVTSIIQPAMFTRTELAATYQVCLDLLRQGSPVDLIVVTAAMRKQGRDVTELLTDLSGRIVTDKHLEHHAAILREKHLLRQYIEAGIALVNACYDEDLETASETIETKLLGLSGLIHRSEPKKLGPLVDGAIQVINSIANGSISLVGVPSGFTDLDRKTGGFKPGELTIIAARPSMGKTALAIQIARNAAGLGHPAAIFSLEMSEGEIARRFISGSSGYSNTELIQGRVDLKVLCDSTTSLLEIDVFIDDTSALSLLELRAKVRRLILRHKIELVVVDYLQLMTGTGPNREQEISFISRGLKSIAKDLAIPVIALSQLNREAESRSDHKPQLSDLRESGAIEQDADLCWLLYRPAYYRIKTVVVHDEEINTDGLMLVNLAKNRNGLTGDRLLKHNQSLTMINEYKDE